MKMKCIRVFGIGSFEITEIPVQEPLANEVLVKVEITGLCRTDLKLIEVGHRDLVLPRIPGEEIVGTIEAIGRNVSEVGIGDRVYVYPGKWCGKCKYCQNNAENLCTEMRIMGFHRDGGFAEYVTVPAQSIIPIPKGLPAEIAIFAEPLSCCLNALELAQLKEGQLIGIWGAGTAGTLLARAASTIGAVPFTIDPDPKRSIRLDGYLSPPGENFDVIVVAVGSKSAYIEALNYLEPRGTMIIFSGLPPIDDTIPISFNQLHYLEQSIIGAYGCRYNHGEDALHHLSLETIKVEDLITHRMPLWDLEHALDLLKKRHAIKILFTT